MFDQHPHFLTAFIDDRIAEAHRRARGARLATPPRRRSRRRNSTE
jgi:anti-sigma factor RsiW